MIKDIILHVSSKSLGCVVGNTVQLISLVTDSENNKLNADIVVSVDPEIAQIVSICIEECRTLVTIRGLSQGVCFINLVCSELKDDVKVFLEVS